LSTLSQSVFPVPRRADLIRRLESANRWGIPLAVLQIFVIAALAAVVDWQQAIRDPIVTLVAIGAIVGPFGMSVAQQLAQKKKRIEDLQEQTRFGQFDKHRLRNLFQDTLRRLNLPDDRLPVYIVADKYMNATMMHWGLGTLFRSLYGINLHRQVLHKLTSAEVQDIMGHELGHYYKYYVVADRFRLLTLIVGALLGILAFQQFQAHYMIGILVLMSASYGLWRLAGLPYARHALVIEYLCDDLGAQVHGVATSIGGLMKLGAEQEVLTAIHRHAVLSSVGGKLNAHEIVDAVTAAIPYGHTSPEDLKAAVEKSLKKKAQEGPSVSGFIRYMWQSDADAAASEEFESDMRKLRKLESVPRLPWESVLRVPSEINFDEQSLPKLISMIENHPNGELFHIPEILGDTDGLHPPIKMRILYLWYNRQEIENAPRL
jgi:Zn-dependent protease with chaperone function